MNSNSLMKQVISFQKAVFDSNYNSVTVFQDYSQSMTDGFIKQIPWVTEEQKKSLTDVFDYIRKSKEEYREAVDKGFVDMEKLFDTDLQ